MMFKISIADQEIMLMKFAMNMIQDLGLSYVVACRVKFNVHKTKIGSEFRSGIN